MKTSLFPHKFNKCTLPESVILGIAGAVLNVLAVRLADTVHIPMYMDSIFTVACSFLSLTCGLICATGFELIVLLLNWPASENVIFLICEVTVVIAVRICVRQSKKGITPFSLIFLALALIISIAIEGGIIYSFLTAYFDYIERADVNSFTFSLYINNIPMLLSSIFGRLPLSTLDKTFATIAGFFIAVQTEKALTALHRA